MVKFTTLASSFSQLEQTSSRNRMTELLAELFAQTTADEISIVCYLSLGRLVPQYESLEFQLAEKMTMKSMASAFDVSKEKVKSRYKEIGDLGSVAEEMRKRQFNTSNRSNNLSVMKVYKRLRKIAEESGEGSQDRKMDGLASLIGELDPLSSRYVVRMVIGKLRLGFSDVTILDSLSWMETQSKELREDLERAYHVRADIGFIAQQFKQHGLEKLAEVQTEIGVPVMPALCQRLKTAEEMIKKMGEVAAEPKYDGQRVQIHFSEIEKGNREAGAEYFLRAFTRNMDEVSYMFPELTKIKKQLNAKRVILDSEAVGYDSTTGEILPFQQIITRKRKHHIAEAAQKVPLKFFVFDLLYKDGKSYLDEPLSKRSELLEETVGHIEGGVLVLADRIVTEQADELRDYHAQQLSRGLEGAVVKKWDDPYRPGRRGWSWVKFKEAEESEAKLSDTLDCVVMGYYRGRGKRAEFGIGGFLVGVLNGERVLTLSKIGTGLTDDQWREMKNRADEVRVSRRPKRYKEVDKTLVPDIWTEPEIVVEIAADNITQSPVHTAGLALRFPRLVRFRDDKSIEQMTTLKEVKRLASLQ